MIKEFFRKLTIFFSIYLITIAPVLAEINNNALPTNPKISSGSATIKQTTNSLTINQTTDKLITNWSSFNIGKDASVEFVQPSSTSAALNRVNASDPSYIYGSLKANGKIILINPSGVLFQGGSKVDVGAIIASSLNLKDGDFLNNKYIFEKDGLAGTVNNSGTINAFKGGAVALLSDQVTNNGIINTPDGTTALLSGEKITLTLNGNRLIKYTIDRGTLNALVENKQAIDAGDGIIILSAKGLTDVSQSVVKNTGTLTAESISKQGGKIYLSARKGEVINSGTLSTNSTEDKGGNIEITGDEITIEENSTLTATGTTGGGQILVGGSWKNSDSSVYQSTVTTVQQNTLIDASATVNGDGGEIVIWSDITNKDSVTTVSGTLYAKGGSQKGDGGRIETSGHYLDSENASISTKAVYGNNGLWLLDPYSLYIGNIDDENIDTFGDPAGERSLPAVGYSKLNLNTLYRRLASNSITLEATNDINLAAEFNYLGTSSDLIFEAPTIAISGNITSNNSLNLTFGSEDGSQNVFLTGSSTITSGNGSISFYGNIGGAHPLTINSGTANTILNSATGGFDGSYWTGASSSSPVNVTIKFDRGAESVIDFSTRTTSGDLCEDCSIPSVFSTSSRTFIKLPTQEEDVTVTYTDGTTEVIATQGTGVNAGIYIPAGKTIKRLDFTTSTGVAANISSDVAVTSYTSNSISNAPTLSSLSVYGNDIELRGDIHTTDAGINGNVFIQAANDIFLDPTISVLTSGGDITFSSDSDYSNEGGITLNFGVTLNSGGGDITLGGRSPADDYAVGSEGSLYRGIYLISSTINAAGGNIILNGKGTQIDAPAGVDYAIGVDLNGLIDTVNLVTTDSGTIEINGVGGKNVDPTVHAVGINILDAVVIQTESGDISLTGTAGTGDAIEDSGILIDGTGLASYIYSRNGNTNLTGIGGSNSIKVNINSLLVGSEPEAAPDSITNGNISLIANSIDSTTGLFNIKGRGTFTVAPYGNDFTRALSWPINNLSIAGISDLTIGKASSADGTNDQDVTISDAISFSGPVTIYGGNIALNNQITSGAGSDVVIVASGDFQNNAGSEVISTPGGGRWIVYTANDDTPINFGPDENSLDSSNTPIWGSTYSSLSPDSVASGNRYVFAESAPGQSVTFTTTDASKIYGSTIDLSSYYTIESSSEIPGLNGVYLATPAGGRVPIGDAFSVNPTFSTSGSNGILASANVGNYTIAAASGILNPGYTVAYVNSGNLSVLKASPSISGLSNQTKTTSDSSFTVAGRPSISGLPIRYTSSDTNVATVNSSTGAVTLVGAGTATITASISGTVNYNAATSAYTLTVSQGSRGGGSNNNIQKASENAMRNATSSIPKNNNKNTPTVNPTTGGGSISGSQPLINFGASFSGGGGASLGGSANTTAGTGQGAGGPGDGTGPGQGAGQGLGPQGGGSSGGGIINLGGGSSGGGGASLGGSANTTAGTGQGAGGPGDGTGPGQGAGQGLGPQGGGSSGGGIINLGGGSSGGGGASLGGSANTTAGTGQGAGGPGDGTGPGQGAGQGLGPQGNNNQQANNSGSGGNNNNNSGGGSVSGGGSGGTPQANNPQGGGGNNNTPTGPSGNQQASLPQDNNSQQGPDNNQGGGNNSTNLAPSNVQTTFFTANTDGSISVRKSNLNANVNVNTEGIIPSAQVVVLRPNQTPTVETGYEVQIANNEAKLRPLQNIDQDFVTPGNVIGSTQFQVEITPGQAFNYTIEVRDGGVVIKPSDPQSIQFAEANRTVVIGSGILEAVSALNIPADQMKTIFLDYQS